MAIHSQEIMVDMPFIRKADLYSREKAYGADVFTEDIPRSNIRTDFVKDISLTDIRPNLQGYSFNENGFEIVSFTSSLNGEDWFNKDKVEEIYCLELGEFMRKRMGASAIQVFEAQVRRRDASFPHSFVDTNVGFQPAMRPHIDASRDHTIAKIQALNGESAQNLLNKPWVYFNVWKPLIGPLRDWPLAICDPATVSKNIDLLEVDNIIKGEHAENIALHYNKNQHWLYLSDHMPDELLVMRQADSKGTEGVPHASFDLPLPEGVTATLRQSVEVRMIAYF